MRKPKPNGDLIISGALTVVGTAMAVQSVGYRILLEGGKIGPGFMPFVAGLALAACSCWAFIEILLKARRTEAAGRAHAPARPVGPAGAPAGSVSAPAGRAATPAGQAGAPESQPVAPASQASAPAGRPVAPGDRARGGAPSPERRAGLVFALTLAAVLLSYVTGFLVAFGLLILVLLGLVEREKPWLAVSVSVVAVALSWLLFIQLLQVPLPGGVLGLLGRS